MERTTTNSLVPFQPFQLGRMKLRHTLTPLSDCRQESVERWNGDFGGFVYVSDRFPQRDFGLWVFMCPINFSVSFPATTPRATTPHRSFRLPQRGLPPHGYLSEGYHAPPLFSQLPRPYICNQANRLPRLQGYHTRATTLQINFWVQAGYHTCG